MATTKTEPPKPKEPPRISDLGELEPVFKADVEKWIALCAVEDLPIWVYETRRSLERQRYERGQGRSNASGENGPHVWGLAVDVVLDPKHASWKVRGGFPQKVGDAGAPWDTGIEMRAQPPGDDGKPQRACCVVVRGHVTDVVARIGALAEQCGLEWGGRNDGPWKSHRPGDLFGFDVFHFQRRHWTGLKSKLPTPEEVLPRPGAAPKTTT